MDDTIHSNAMGIMARGGTLTEVLAAICRAVEDRHGDIRSSIFLVDETSKRLILGAAPSLPAEFTAACDGLQIAPAAGSCGTAAWRGEMVVVEDVATDPLWDEMRDLALQHGVRACWSYPIHSRMDEIVGTFALYHGQPARPTPEEVVTVRLFADLVSIAIDQQRTHHRRRETEQRLGNLVGNVPGIVFQWSAAPDGEIEISFFSDSAKDFMGLSGESITRDPVAFLHCIHADERDACLEAMRHSATTLEPMTKDFRLEDAESGERWLHVRSRPRRRADGTVVSEAIGVDITDRKSTERALAQSEGRLREQLLEVHRTKTRLESQTQILLETTRDLTRARDLAEEASRAKSDFLSNMSHELRTPLNAIIGFSEIIKDQLLGPVGSEKYCGYARDICDAGQHLLALINDILDYSKAESGNAGLSEDILDVSEMVNSVCTMLKGAAQKAELTLTADLACDLPLLRADQRKLKQILINVVSNAIKFTEAGGTVTIKSWRSDGSGFVFQVADTGVGIALDDIPTALRLFGQIDSPFSRHHQGTGLGLPLSKSFAELHGGSLNLQSQPGVGTTVTVRLPSSRIVQRPARGELAAAGE